MKILTRPFYKYPANNLSDDLKDILNEEVIITSNPNDIIEYPFIRYGNSLPVNCKTETNYNSPENIKLAAIKLRFSREMERRGFYSPIYKRDIPTKFPVLIRTKLSGTGGEGIIPINNLEEFYDNWDINYYWTEYVNLKFEVRALVVDTEILRIFKKVRGDWNPEEANIVIRSNYHYSIRNVGRYRKLEELIKEINLVGFYGVDVGWDAEKKKYFILEINSAPGINKNSSRILALKLAEKL